MLFKKAHILRTKVRKKRSENIWLDLNNPVVNVIITTVLMNEDHFGLKTVPR
jgi:hypothetical protein